MFDALAIAATGMQAQQQHVETIANNLVNANTTAFKKGRVSFSELLTRGAASPGVGDEGRAGAAAMSTMMPAGVGVVAVGKVFEQGELKKTGSPMDLAIEGEGFLEVTLPGGESAFTRGGTLQVKDGVLLTAAGHALKRSITVPADTRSLSINADGRVMATTASQKDAIELDQLELVRFANPAMLAAQGDSLYRPTDAAGQPVPSRPGEEGAGTFAQGFLESSNVKMVDEVVGLMMAQRAYEASVKLIQAADEMAGMVNNLRK